MVMTKMPMPSRGLHSSGKIKMPKHVYKTKKKKRKSNTLLGIDECDEEARKGNVMENGR